MAIIDEKEDIGIEIDIDSAYLDEDDKEESIKPDKPNRSLGIFGEGVTQYLNDMSRFSLLKDGEQALFEKLHQAKLDYYTAVFTLPSSIDHYISLSENITLNKFSKTFAAYFSPYHSLFRSNKKKERDDNAIEERQFLIDVLVQNVKTLSMMIDPAALDNKPRARLARAAKLVLEVPPKITTLDSIVEFLDKREQGPVIKGSMEDKDWAAGLDSTEFKEHVNCIHAAQARYRELKDSAINANLRLVVSIAKRYQKRGLPLNDLIQYGNIGLLKAMERYDHRMDNRFGTYATWWIRQNIMRNLQDYAKSVRVPVHILEKRKAYVEAAIRLRTAHNKDPSQDQLIKETGFSRNEIIKVEKAMKGSKSLDEPITEDGRHDLSDLIIADRDDEPLKASSQNELREKINEVLSTLSDREREILKSRFGLSDNGHQRSPMTLEEAGKQFGITRERTRQIEVKAIMKLRHRSKSIAKGYFATDIPALEDIDSNPNAISMTELVHRLRWTYNSGNTGARIDGLLEAYNLRRSEDNAVGKGRKKTAKMIPLTRKLDELIHTWKGSTFDVLDVIRESDYKITIREASRMMENPGDMGLQLKEDYVPFHQDNQKKYIFTKKGLDKFRSYVANITRKNP
jgi:RNA polymerase sigma factor (sigma-70 family)